MATVDFPAVPSAVLPVDRELRARRRLHRLRTLRRQQGISLQEAAEQMGADIRQLRIQEQEETDLRLSDLYRWQQVLGVPVEQILVEPQSSLSHPVIDHSRCADLQEITQQIHQRCRSTRVRRMAQTLLQQISELSIPVDGESSGKSGEVFDRLLRTRPDEEAA